MSQPPKPLRYVTGHDDDGNAIFKVEGEIPLTKIPEKSGRDSLFGVPWQSYEFPADLSESKWKDAVTEGGPLHNESGTLCLVVEFPPQTSSPFHQTISLDYGILCTGEMWIELDNGAERRLSPGDVVVQRGTLHAWHNKTDEYARMVFVLTAAKQPLIVAGKELGNLMLKD